MNPKSGKAPSPVAPSAPIAADPADQADPAEIAEAKKAQADSGKGKYGKTELKAAGSDDEDEEKTAWIEFELVDEEDNPVPGEKYEVTLPDDTISKGTLDPNGFARIENILPGNCKICFPDLDKDAWEKA